VRQPLRLLGTGRWDGRVVGAGRGAVSAQVEAGPVHVARPHRRRFGVIGFGCSAAPRRGSFLIGDDSGSRHVLFPVPLNSPSPPPPRRLGEAGPIGRHNVGPVHVGPIGRLNVGPINWVYVYVWRHTQRSSCRCFRPATY
jgi:hypothetical protein